MAFQSGLSNWVDKAVFEMGKTGKTCLEDRKSSVLFWTCSSEVLVGSTNGDTSLEFKKRLRLKTQIWESSTYRCI